MTASNPQRATEQDALRPLDPDVSQRCASDPDISVCVGASAGTGKTKVLTDRVLRLLLPRDDGRPGTPPTRILCLTYTKAAAAEMLNRLGKVLGEWAVAPPEKLEAALAKLTGQPPSASRMAAARRLFAAASDSPGGLKIMTIHSFCQSVLARFPLEADLGPQFSVMEDDQSRLLLRAARDTILARARREPQAPLGAAMRALSVRQNEQQFDALLGRIATERRQFRATAADPAALRGRVCTLAGLPPDATAESVIAQACTDRSFDRDGLYRICRALAGGTAGEAERAYRIQAWLDRTPEERTQAFAAYAGDFLTKENEVRKLVSAKTAKAYPEAPEILEYEGERLARITEALRSIDCADITRDLACAGAAILDAYDALKSRRGLLDYDDLTLKTLDLLEQPAIAPWILYKLDGGLDHILVDEAQDTNPEQWLIIDHLCREFYSGMGARDDETRTIFTVGDEKQSIYSFQRAAPEEFARMKAHFKTVAGAREEHLSISFRSAPSVLRLVDEVFAPAACRKGLGDDIPAHASFRRGQAGLAELWPLTEPDEPPDEAPWTPPVTIVETRSGSLKLAEQIATAIAGWLADGEILPSQGRALHAGDILILVRTRTALVNQLVRALKTRRIPVSGVDRMVLGEQIAVMDLLAAAQFALLPADDLTLACVLRSPFIGMMEDNLMTLAVPRAGTLWQALAAAPAHSAIATWLQALIPLAARLPPYEFFSHVLQNPCPGSAVSGLHALQGRLGAEALDPIEELLNAAIGFEGRAAPSLPLFLLRQQRDDSQLKREMEEAGSAVRIMTVHGAKGLQAPVVILADTTRTGSSRRIDTLLWPNRTGLDVPVFSPRSEDHPPLFRAARERVIDALDNEYRRQLYVALTRAEDRLYIAGCRGRTAPLPDCWYNMAAAAFDRFPDTERGADGRCRITNPQTADPDRAGKSETATASAAVELPDWLRVAAPPESPLARPLMPSRPMEPDPPARSPLAAADDYRFRRGNVTHKLLQFLPDLPPPQRRQAAENYVFLPVHDLPDDIRRGIAEETLAIMERPDLAPLFGLHSLAEVPVSGIVDGRAVSAQIDRLVIMPDEVLIIDYKTNRPPPAREQDVDPLYRGQLTAYRRIIMDIYPGRRIRCFLLWTDGARLMELQNL